MHFRIRCSVSENELRTPSTSIYLMYFGIKVVTYIIQLSNMNLYISLSYTNEIIFAITISKTHRYKVCVKKTIFYKQKPTIF